MIAEEKKLEEIAELVFSTIFSDEKSVNIDGKDYPVKRTSGKRLRYIDVKIGDNGYRCMEQNPDKGSHWAKLAKQGEKIMWIFKDWKYHARVMNGKFTLLKH